MVFVQGHSRITTHRIQVLHSSAREYILNFIGGNLPKRPENSEPSEEYARMMLILFKPGGWRTRRELKCDTSSWKETFELTEFSPRSRHAMVLFNTFYESRDARFDFSQERRKSAGKRSTGIVTLDKYIDEYATMETEEHEALRAMPPTELRHHLTSISNSETLGNKMKRILTEMNEMKSFLSEDIGHSASVKEAYASAVESDIPFRSAREWRSTLQIAKEKICAERLGFLPTTVEEHTDHPASDGRRFSYPSSEGNVVIIDPASVNELCRQYSHENFTNMLPLHIIQEIQKDFSLNKGQLRAYDLIVNHLNRPPHPPLRMYLGGIGGTGKSRVIKSLIAYLAARNQTHRFIVVAPTGSAAALIDGSTYHSVLGFGNLKTVNTENGLIKVKEDLAGVDLIFLDEISMVSCEDLYKISRRLTKAFPLTNEPFGGKSMIVAGDFRQLPPGSPFSHPLYSGSIGVIPDGVKGRLQRPVMGKSFWMLLSLQH
ncbi:hypothetical protein NLI96_g10640 [Meripilus lineatus]|uniref:ATP-dependent DNA helicase n=1 Tax=Meripilus lineatus TaxID=2056292 RepID=A0AAD5UTF0_9APHY|nr:hypothetical protein NLI96_g10640 [Physisporinus lineatus]